MPPHGTAAGAGGWDRGSGMGASFCHTMGLVRAVRCAGPKRDHASVGIGGAPLGALRTSALTLPSLLLASSQAGVGFSSPAGGAIGSSQVVAQASVTRAVLFHSLLIPGCALLAPVVAMRFLVVPQMLRRAPGMLAPTSGLLTIGCTCVA